MEKRRSQKENKNIKRNFYATYMSLVLHAIILHKPKFKSKDQSLAYARQHFQHEHIKGFVRETESSFRVRVVPKTKFINTSYVSKVISPDATLVFGKLKK